MSENKKISFNPKKITEELLSVLSERSRDVLMQRYGLGREASRATLEKIGQQYGITRERVRQIENQAIRAIKKSELYAKQAAVFDELKEKVKIMGGIIAEEDLLDSISPYKTIHNHLHFLLVVGDHFTKYREDDFFRHRWQVDEVLSGQIHESLKRLYQSLSNEDLVTEPDIIKKFIAQLQGVAEEYKREEIVKRWLSLSKKISQNSLGEWGRTESTNINAKGVRDYAYLIIRKHGSPIHFRKVAKNIEEEFKRKAHEATTHNELIKDPRFVLVGRGLYALSEWGYSGGVVREVIQRILVDRGPLTKEEVVREVLKERQVKENTILVNLQNPRYFQKDQLGRYSPVKTTV